MFVLITLPMGTMTEFREIGETGFDSNHINILELSFLFIILGLKVYFWIKSLHLHRLNSSWKKRQFLR